MHELSLAQALVEEVERIRVRENATRVLSVTVDIGALSGVDRESFSFAFPLATAGTRLADAALVVHETAAEVTCMDCGKITTPELTHIRCEDCGSEKVQITRGRDFLMHSVELRVEDEQTDAGTFNAGKGGTGHV